MILPRVQGVFVLVNTMLPPLVVLAIGWTVVAFGGRVDAGWQETRGALVSIAARAGDSAQRVADVAERSQAQMNRAMARFEVVGAGLSRAASEVRKPVDAVASLSVPTVAMKMSDLYIDPPGPIPRFKAGPFKPEITPGSFAFGEMIAKPFRVIFDALSSLSAPFDDLAKVAKELEKLNALQPEFAALQAEVGLVARNAVAFFGAASDVLGWFAGGTARLGRALLPVLGHRAVAARLGAAGQSGDAGSLMPIRRRSRRLPRSSSRSVFARASGTS